MTGQQLKNSILQEAIEGRLVPQDPNDEPASVLLERIRAEKARLVKEKKIKKDKNESRIYRTEDGHWMEHFEDKNREDVCIDEEIPFDLPSGWEWCRISHVFETSSGSTPQSKNPLYYSNGIINWVRTTDLNNNILSSCEIKITQEAVADYNLSIIPQNSICIAMYGGAGTIGKHSLIKFDTTINQSVCAIHPQNFINMDYIHLFIQYQRPNWMNYAAGSRKDPNINQIIIKKCLFPLPPLAEQHRIVEKIESLLPKVEAYGKAQEELEKLNEALPEQLKRSILQEAIEGRLVPQDPNDEPASALLEHIRTEKARLVKEKKIKKDKNESRIYRTEDGHWMEHFEDKNREDVCIDEEIPFDLPNGWEWCRLKENVSIISGLSYKKENLEVSSDKYIRVLRGGNITYGNWCSKADDVMIAEKFVPQELILKSGTFISPAVTSLEHMGKTALVREDQDDIVVGGFVLMLIPFYKNNSYLEYLNSIFQTAYYKEKCQSITNKSGQAFYNLSRAKLLEVLIPLPPLAEQHRIVEKLEEILPKLNNLKKETEK